MCISGSPPLFDLDISLGDSRRRRPWANVAASSVVSVGSVDWIEPCGGFSPTDVLWDGGSGEDVAGEHHNHPCVTRVRARSNGSCQSTP